jgi:hypothetical protein
MVRQQMGLKSQQGKNPGEQLSNLGSLGEQTPSSLQEAKLALELCHDQMCRL